MSDKLKREILRVFKGLGFVPFRGSTLWLRAGDLFHVVEVRKSSGYPSFSIYVAVWHPGWASRSEGEELPFLSPLYGYLTRHGVMSNGLIDENSFDAKQIAKSAALFFGAFSSVADLILWKADWPNADAFDIDDRLLRWVGRVPDCDGSPLYAVPGGGGVKSRQVSVSNKIFEALALPDSFGVTKDPFVKIRNRGVISDCVAVRFDKHSTVASVWVSNWTPEIWRVEPFMKGNYHPHNGGPVADSLGQEFLVPTYCDSELTDLRSLTAVALNRAEAVKNLSDFIPTIHDRQDSVVQKLIRRL